MSGDEIRTWVVFGHDEQPLAVKARKGLVTIGFSYDSELSINANHRHAAVEMAMIAGMTVSEVSRLQPTREGREFVHKVGPYQAPKMGVNGGILQKSTRGD